MLLFCCVRLRQRNDLGIAFTQPRVEPLSLLVEVPEPIASKAKKEMYEARLEEYKHQAVHPLMLQGPCYWRLEINQRITSLNPSRLTKR